MGRPKAEINETEVERLALEGNNNCDIAAKFGVDESVIRDRFPEILRKKRAELRACLRTAQIEKALGGDTTMQIWLGKQYLEQADKSEVKSDNKTHVEFAECSDTELIARTAALFAGTAGSSTGNVLQVQAAAGGTNGVHKK